MKVRYSHDGQWFSKSLIFIKSLNCCKFPFILKHPNVTPVFKKGYCGSKENYCPVSIKPVMSNIFEQLLCKQPKCLQIKIFQNISAALEKVLVHNIP